MSNKSALGNVLPNFPSTFPMMIGFDDIFKTIQFGTQDNNNNKFPPHDIMKLDDEHYVIKMALAGFSKDEIEISKEQNMLTVSSDDVVLKMKEDSIPDPQPQYIHRGISKRGFTKRFALKDGIIVESASFADGILSIKLQQLINKEKVSIINIE